MDKKMHLFVVAGEGGHYTQALLLSDLLIYYGCKVTILTERGNPMLHDNSSASLTPSSSRLKGELRKFYLVPLFLTNTLQILRSLRQYEDIDGVIGLGPFVNLPAYVACILLRIRFCCVESRSRFRSLSKSNKLIRRLGGKIFTQNKLKDSSAIDILGRIE